MVRIVWRFNRAQVEFQKLLGPVPQAVLDLNLPFGQIRPVFSGPRIRVQDAVEERSSAFKENPVNDMVRYYQVYVEDEDAARPILQALERARSLGIISYFDLQKEIRASAVAAGLGANPPGILDGITRCQFDPGPTGPSQRWDQCQRYLDPPASTGHDPSGVNARFAWSLQGGRAEGIDLVDVEEGWNLNHEDLQGQVTNVFAPIVGHRHGTAVLGILCGRDDQPTPVGVIGVANRATVGVMPFQIAANGNLPDPEDTIKQIAQSIPAGSVILIEVHAVHPEEPGGGCNPPYLPIEAWEHGQTALSYAHDKGIYVVEIAGNGGFNLDQVARVPRSGSAFMVGAGHPVTGQAIRCSNVGERVDLQGWGQEVVTAGSVAGGFRDLQFRNDTNFCYMSSFDGTSSAAAIVAGCIAVVSGVVKAHGFTPLSAAKMKELLKRTGSFRSSADVINGLIGPLPNLKAALEDLETELKQNNLGFQGFQQV